MSIAGYHIGQTTYSLCSCCSAWCGHGRGPRAGARPVKAFAARPGMLHDRYTARNLAPPPQPRAWPARAMTAAVETYMRQVCLLALLLMSAPALASADTAGDAAQCQRDAGTFLTGTVVRAPRFVAGKERRQGVYLSHTRLTLRGDDRQSYDVAIDNVFANGYRRNQPSIP